MSLAQARPTDHRMETKALKSFKLGKALWVRKT